MAEKINVSVRLTPDEAKTVDTERKKMIRQEGADVSRAEYFRRFIPTGPRIAKPGKRTAPK